MSKEVIRQSSRGNVISLMSGLLSTAGIAAMCCAAPAFAQTPNNAEDEAFEIEEILISSTRSRISNDVSSVPGSLTLISAEELQKQASFSTDLGEILARTVPGLGVSSSGSFSNFNQTLRGRRPAVFIDGIPATVPLRDAGRDVRLISPGAIGQIEVIAGSTALYGLGGAGGIINYATKEPTAEGINFQTDVSVGASLDTFEDSTNFTLQQGVNGRTGDVSYVFSGFYEKYNSLYDADGERIIPDPQQNGGIADTDAFNIYGKVTYDITTDQKFSASVNYYEIEQNTDFSPGVGNVFGETAVPAIEVPPQGQNQSTSNLVTSARYTHEDVFGSSVSLQAFYSEYEAVFAFFDNPVFPPNGGQSLITAERFGLRFEVDSSFDIGSVSTNVLWGIDYVRDDTTQPLTDGRLLVPPMEQQSIAPFAQLEVDATDWLKIVGGARFEIADVSVDTFTTIPIFDPFLPGGDTIEGGTNDYEEFLVNIGFVLSPFDGNLEGFDIYGGFSQGFSVGDYGRAIRAFTGASVEEFDFQAQIINSYEIGFRHQGDNFRYSLAGFLSTSDFGSSFNAVTLELARAPEEVWGIEGMIEVEPAEGWLIGANFVMVNGTVDDPDLGGAVTAELQGFGLPVTIDSIERPLDTSRIAPTKFVAYVEREWQNGWAARVQATHSGRQDRFREPIIVPDLPVIGDFEVPIPVGFGTAPVEAFTLVDVSVKAPAFGGTVTLAINNLLNSYYFTADAFRAGEAVQFTPGMGTNARLTYSIAY